MVLFLLGRSMTGKRLRILAAAIVIAPDQIDVPVFAGVPAILLLVAALACWIPVRRAARISPMAALRED